MARSIRDPDANHAREQRGCIVTLERRSDRLLISRHVPGLLQAGGLASLLDRYEAKTWRVASISTPRTILADLQGRRSARRSGDERYDDSRMELPEANILGQIGRGDRAG